MCMYCENYNRPPFELDIGDLIIISPAKYTVVGDGALYGMPMVYCPACGERVAVSEDE